jgi:cation diffusion facilitator CzcD-associated flavoprotein CzcO
VRRRPAWSHALAAQQPGTVTVTISPLCFEFEAQNLQLALDLADELRRHCGNHVSVRPNTRLCGSRRWTVALTTPPAPPYPMVLELWEKEMAEIAARCPGCQFVDGGAKTSDRGCGA